MIQRYVAYVFLTCEQFARLVPRRLHRSCVVLLLLCVNFPARRRGYFFPLYISRGNVRVYVVMELFVCFAQFSIGTFFPLHLYPVVTDVASVSVNGDVSPSLACTKREEGTESSFLLYYTLM